MKRPEIQPVGINEVADNVVRGQNEPESIDLAAEATDGAPAKSLAPQKEPTRPRGKSRSANRLKR